VESFQGYDKRRNGVLDSGEGGPAQDLVTKSPASGDGKKDMLSTLAAKSYKIDQKNLIRRRF